MPKATHKMSNTRLYKVWSEMKRRCNNPNDNVYKYYGGKGISYDKDWETFEPFYKWAIENGYKDDAERGEFTLDRIDSNGDYSANNCRWATQLEQANNKNQNRRIEIDGVAHTIAEWGRISGVKVGTIDRRLRVYGFSPKEAVYRENGTRNTIKIELNGERHTLREWAIRLGLSKNTISERLKRGWDIERALTTGNMNTKI